jgi:phage tail sheath protein FI
MLWAVFEPIGPALYLRLESALTTYLESLLAKGVTASQRTAEAYYVRCDEGTNPDAQVRAGTVVAEIGIALLAPAEFIVLTARRTPDAVHVIEEEV